MSLQRAPSSMHNPPAPIFPIKFLYSPPPSPLPPLHVPLLHVPPPHKVPLPESVPWWEMFNCTSEQLVVVVNVGPVRVCAWEEGSGGGGIWWSMWVQLCVWGKGMYLGGVSERGVKLLGLESSTAH